MFERTIIREQPSQIGSRRPLGPNDSAHAPGQPDKVRKSFPPIFEPQVSFPPLEKALLIIKSQLPVDETKIGIADVRRGVNYVVGSPIFPFFGATKNSF